MRILLVVEHLLLGCLREQASSEGILDEDTASFQNGHCRPQIDSELGVAASHIVDDGREIVGSELIKQIRSNQVTRTRTLRHAS